MPQNSIKPAAVDDWAPVPSTEGADDWAPVPTVAAKPPKQGFKRSLRTATGLKPEGTLSDDISQIGSGFKQMATHPFTSANDLVEGLWSSQSDVADKARTRMQGPRLMDQIEGAGQLMESVIPVAGPVLSRMGEQVEEGDYTGAVGTGLPLASAMDTGPLRGAIGDVARTPGGAVKPAPRLATEIGAAALGHEALPYAGGYIGWKAGGPLSEMIIPKRTDPMWPGAKATPWEAPVEPAPSAPASEATQTLRGNKTLFDAPGATSSASGPGAARGPEGPSAKPRLSARETSEYLKSKGRSAGRLSEDIDAADADAGTGTGTGARAKENLSPYMRRKVGEAEGRHDAGRMAATGAVTGEDSRVASVERRVNPGLRAATGPDPVRQSLVREAQRVIDDPKSTVRDKRIAQDQISDIKAHPFEGAYGKDFVKEARAGKPTMTRKQAEAASEKRSPGRKKRLAEEMGND